MTKRHRNAKTGHFASAAEAEAAPEQHVAETVREPVHLAVERMNDHFVKVHVAGTGIVMHMFTAADGPDSQPHDHPFAADIRVLSGGYVEQRFDVDRPHDPPLEITRREGDVFRNEAGTVHRIIRLLDGGPVLTEFRPGPHELEPGFYDFREDGVWHRLWHEAEFAPLKRGVA